VRVLATLIALLAFAGLVGFADLVRKHWVLALLLVVLVWLLIGVIFR
jgi:hypothetical protein